MTEHDEFESKIPALAAGRLAPEEEPAVLAHLAQCDRCAGVLAAAREVAALRDHPTVAQLRHHALATEGAGDVRVDEHLAACASCALEVAVWRRKRTRATRRRFGVAAAVAAAAAIVLAVWLGPWALRDRSSAPEDATGEATLTFSLGTRAAGSPRIVTVDPSRPLGIRAEWESLEPPEAIGPVRLEIAEADGAALWTVTIDGDRVARELHETGALFAEAPAGALVPGKCVFRMTRVARADEPPMIEEPFVVQGVDQRQSPDATKAPQ